MLKWAWLQFLWCFLNFFWSSWRLCHSVDIEGILAQPESIQLLDNTHLLESVQSKSLSLQFEHSIMNQSSPNTLLLEHSNSKFESSTQTALIKLVTEVSSTQYPQTTERAKGRVHEKEMMIPVFSHGQGHNTFKEGGGPSFGPTQETWLELCSHSHRSTR